MPDDALTEALRRLDTMTAPMPDYALTRTSLHQALLSKPYRDAYVAAQIHMILPFQLRALRTARGWTQAELAYRIGMTQPRIAELECPGARHMSLQTLLRLAAAFDIGLQVQFVAFDTLANWAEHLDPDAFNVSSFTPITDVSAEGDSHD